MTQATVVDEQLVSRLPLPLAQLYRRAHNAKTALDRFLVGYHLWEASLKLLSSVAVVEYAALPEHDQQLMKCLRNLARPSVGQWWEFIRRLTPVLAEEDRWFAALRDVLLGPRREDLPRAAGLEAVLRETVDGERHHQTTVRLFDLFTRLCQFRNRELGHGAAGQRSEAHYERVGRALVSGVANVLEQLDVLVGRRLVYVDEVRRSDAGLWVVECCELMGESARRLEPHAESDVSALPLPKRVYLQRPPAARDERPFRAYRSLHPLVTFAPETSEVFFLNSRRGRAAAEYLCYGSGNVVQREQLLAAQEQLLAEILGVPVAAAEIEQWSASSQAEDGLSGEELPPPEARRLGEFELCSILGRGGMAIVYRARQPSLDRPVAVKCLLDPQAESRFAREIRALGRVDHPHVVKVFTAGADSDRYFYAMELIEGADLGSVLEQLRDRRAGEMVEHDWQQAVTTAYDKARSTEEWFGGQRPASPRESPPDSPLAEPGNGPQPMIAATQQACVGRVVEIVRQAAEAIQALHQAGIIHRDVKPGNIMLTADGSRAVLMDLGLAQIADAADGRLTRTRQFVGTLRYASPEQVRAIKQVDGRSDVYSLGATLWELLTLQPLFGATEDIPAPDLMEQIQHRKPEPIRRYNALVPRDLEAIAYKCLEKKADDRYASAADLSQDLARWQRGQPVSAWPSGPYRLRKFLWRQRRTLASAVLAFAVLLAVSVGGYFAFRAAVTAQVEALAGRERAQAKERELHNARRELQPTPGAALDAAESAPTPLGSLGGRMRAGVQTPSFWLMLGTLIGAMLGSVSHVFRHQLRRLRYGVSTDGLAGSFVAVSIPANLLVLAFAALASISSSSRAMAGFWNGVVTVFGFLGVLSLWRHARRCRRVSRNVCPMCLTEGSLQPDEHGEFGRFGSVTCRGVVEGDPNRECGFSFPAVYRSMDKLYFPTLGHPSSGKTLWSAMLYRELSLGNYVGNIEFHKIRSKSAEVFDRLVEDLIIHRVGPAATQASELPYPLIFDFQDHDRWGRSRALISLFDYSGEVMGGMSLDQPQRRRALVADAYLVFCDPTQSSHHQKRELVDFAADVRLLQRSATVCRPARMRRRHPPVAICMPKIDLLVSVLSGYPDLERFYRDLAEIDDKYLPMSMAQIEARSTLVSSIFELVFPGWQIERQVSTTFGGRCMFFPLTPVGLGELGETDLRERILQPYGILEPLLWLLHVNGYPTLR